GVFFEMPLIPELSGMMLAQPQLDPPARYAYLNPTLAQFIPENETNLEVLNYLQNQAKTSVDYSLARKLVLEYWPDSLAVAAAE
ncbi:MAG: hypothetical protein DLM68_11020, partial [Hyphomicrobiales bacterium]